MTEMTSRERLLTALRCQEPDRVPFLESAVDEAVALALLGKPVPTDLVGGELGTSTEPVLIGHLMGSARYDELALIRDLGLDAIGMYCFARHGGIQAKVDGHYMVAGGSIKRRADLARIVAADGDLHLSDPDDPALYEPYRRFLAETRDTGLARYCFLNLASDPVILGMGFDTFALALYDDRSLVEDLFEIYSSWYARVTKHLCELDFDFLWFGDDIAFKTAPYVSPRIFRQLFMPHYRRVVDQITKPWIFHSDGNLMPILDDLLSLGMSGLHPIEPGAMDLALLKTTLSRQPLPGRTHQRGHPQPRHAGRGGCAGEAGDRGCRPWRWLHRRQLQQHRLLLQGRERARDAARHSPLWTLSHFDQLR